MFFDKHPDVLVTGAGPVGLIAALTLARRDVQVQIVDTGVWPCQHSYALALHPETLELLDSLGLKDEILAAAYPVRTVALYDGTGRRGEVRLAGDGMAVTRQDALEEILERKLDEAGVKIQWRHEVARLTQSDGKAQVRINKFEKEARGYIVAHTEWVVAKSTDLEVPFVIGADGYSSTVRRAADIEFPEVGPAQYFAVFEFETDADLAHETRMVLGEQGASVLWPLPGGRCRWSFQLKDYSDKAAEELKDRLRDAGLGFFPTDRAKDRVFQSSGDTLPVLDEENLRSFLIERAPWFQGSIGRTAWKTVVRFERRLASSFGKGRLWLAGDSAHLTGPVGIQSMNTGLAEGHDLAETLARILKGESGEADLQAYNRRWMAEWKRLHGLSGGLKATPGADPWFAAHSGDLLASLPAHGPALDQVAGQLQLAF